MNICGRACPGCGKRCSLPGGHGSGVHSCYVGTGGNDPTGSRHEWEEGVGCEVAANVVRTPRPAPYIDPNGEEYVPVHPRRSFCGNKACLECRRAGRGLVRGDEVTIHPKHFPGDLDTEPGAQPWKAIYIGSVGEDRILIQMREDFEAGKGEKIRVMGRDALDPTKARQRWEAA